MELVGGRYVLEDQLGEGGQGQVYRVRHAQLGKPFALKVISPAFANDTAARERFNEEAKLASEISHPNIVSIVDYGEDNTLGAYMVMELIDGGPLLLADSSGPPSIKRGLEILGQVCDALEYIHKRGIVHGDVKAENILMMSEPPGVTGKRRRNHIRLLDFGLARRHGTHEDQVNGSPHYLAPERIQGGPPSVASDVYALGVLGYALFTRTLPFDGNVGDVLIAQLHHEPEAMSKRRGEQLDEALEQLIARAMAKDPAVRHASAAAFRYELNTVMDMLGVGRKRRSSNNLIKLEDPRSIACSHLFEHSKLPQAVISVDGTIEMANAAFAKLVGHSGVDLASHAIADTRLVASVPGLMKAMRAVHVDGRPVQLHVEVSASLSLALWLTPAQYGDDLIHVLVHVSGSSDRG